MRMRPRGFFPILNGGELAALYCFVFPTSPLPAAARGASTTCAAREIDLISLPGPGEAVSPPRLLTKTRASLGLVPVEDLLAGPEMGGAGTADVLDHAAEIFEAVRRAHDVGVQDDRHDARGVARVVV